jgi:hypothetical protein
VFASATIVLICAEASARAVLTEVIFTAHARVVWRLFAVLVWCRGWFGRCAAHFGEGLWFGGCIVGHENSVSWVLNAVI